MPIKSFRGKILEGADNIQTISLHTNDGKTGYKITKLEVIGESPGTVSQESTFKIFSVPQTATTNAIDFSDQTLLAVAFFESDASTSVLFKDTVIFDNVTFNQDIYLTHKSGSSGKSLNYHIELELVNLALDENTVATLKDIRNIKSQ